MVEAIFRSDACLPSVRLLELSIPAGESSYCSVDLLCCGTRSWRSGVTSEA